MKYDIQFIIPICLKHKYKKRFEFFRKNGLFNIKDKKVLVTLLCETNDLECLIGWEAGIDVELIHCPHNQEAAKVYYYLSDYPAAHLQNIRWISKIDDDSLTDVSDLVEQLDDFGDYQKEFYFAAEILKNIEPEEKDLCDRLGYGYWFHRQIDGPYVAHEVEGSFMSQKAMQTIYSNEKALKFLKERAKIHSGYTDIALACAARICKIYPYDTNFLTSEATIGDLSFFGGKFSHIHFIAPDINKKICTMFNSVLHKKQTSKEKQHYDNKKFILQENQQNICKFQLMPNHKVKILSSVKNAPPPYDWTLWNVHKEKLYFIGWDGSLIYKFEKTESNKLKGKRRYENMEGILKPYE